MLRKLVAGSAALLVLFHAWLFGSQLVDGRLADAALLGRWAVAGLLAAALWRLRRQGISLFWGRRATAIWLLAALLHGPAAADRVNSPQFQVPDDVTMVVGLATLLLGAGLLVGVGRRRLADPASATCVVAPAAADVSFYLLSSGAPFAPRPPPAR